MTTNTDPNATADLQFCVNLWGSHPDEGNDDCDTGESFATIEEARRAYDDIDGVLLARKPGHTVNPLVYFAGWSYAELTGPDGLQEVKPNPDQRAVRARARENARFEREWQTERAMQAGMVFGCEGYNDEMGY